MCGRFALDVPAGEMVDDLQAVPDNDLPPLPNYNICPTDRVHVLRRAGGGAEARAGRRLVAMRWGFLPGWYATVNGGPLLINARAESVAEKPAFREAIRDRRCIIPASGFYEWEVTPEGARLPWYVCRADGAPLLLAGLWQDWEREGIRLSSCAIVTTAAGPATSHIHHRMPVVVERPSLPRWLGEEGPGAALLMRPAAEDLLRCHRVGPEVNSNRARGPGLVAPLG